VVAHGASVTTVQAGFAGLVMEDRDQVASALRSIETTGRQTLVEMRSLLDVLRVPGGDPRDEARGRSGLAGLHTCECTAATVSGDITELPWVTPLRSSP
jgi:signal transduction histidine kinase